MVEAWLCFFFTKWAVFHVSVFSLLHIFHGMCWLVLVRKHLECYMLTELDTWYANCTIWCNFKILKFSFVVLFFFLFGGGKLIGFLAESYIQRLIHFNGCTLSMKLHARGIYLSSNYANMFPKTLEYYFNDCVVHS